VEAVRRYTNRSDLLSNYAQVREHVGKASTGSDPEDDPELVPTGNHPRARLLGNRLTDVDVQTLVSDYQAGTTGRELAARYNISRSSVKNILREHGARRKDQRP
jgi:hypothetical protein